MKKKKLVLTCVTMSMMITTLLYTSPLHAESNPAPSVYLDGDQLAFQSPPVIENDYTLVPMRALFEAEGATVTWEESTKTVTAMKDGTRFTYRIGENVAHKNQEVLELPLPGKIIDGSTMVPLRFISETLGNFVKWHEYSRSITISSVHTLETTIQYGVNLRDAPDKNTNTHVLQMLPKSEKIHVIRDINANWLEVQTKDGIIGFISADPMYSDFKSSTEAEKQADSLIAFGSKFLGIPYEFGAAVGQTNTFDCSSFVKYIFNEVLSIQLPRPSYDQALKGKEVGINELRKGDLLFFRARGLDIGHVALYAGNGKLLHTYSKELGVHFEEFDETWKKRFVVAKRLF